METEIIKTIIESYKIVSSNHNVFYTNKGKQNNKRSYKFIEAATENLKTCLNQHSNIKVFSKSCDKDKEFKLSEFMYDIHVCTINTLNSVGHSIPIEYIEKSLVQIESELDKNTRSIAIDFSKLVCGKSDLKIMIISKTYYDEKLRSILECIAKKIAEPLYLIELDHPSKWERNIINEFSIYNFRDKWVEVSKNY